MKKIKRLIVATYKNELKPIIDMGKKHCLIQDNTAYLSAGVGPTAAAFGLTHFLKIYKPDLIITIGTAGIINTKKYNIGEIALVKSVGIHSGFAGFYLPTKAKSLILKPQFVNQNKSLAKLKTLNKVSVFCPQEITQSVKLRSVLLKSKYDAENLEAYAYAFVAQKFNCPLVSLLGFTNIVGPQGHKEWKQNESELCLGVSKLLGLL